MAYRKFERNLQQRVMVRHFMSAAWERLHHRARNCEAKIQKPGRSCSTRNLTWVMQTASCGRPSACAQTAVSIRFQAIVRQLSPAHCATSCGLVHRSLCVQAQVVGIVNGFSARDGARTRQSRTNGMDKPDRVGAPLAAQLIHRRRPRTVGTAGQSREAEAHARSHLVHGRPAGLCWELGSR